MHQVRVQPHRRAKATRRVNSKSVQKQRKNQNDKKGKHAEQNLTDVYKVIKQKRAKGQKYEFNQQGCELQKNEHALCCKRKREKTKACKRAQVRIQPAKLATTKERACTELQEKIQSRHMQQAKGEFKSKATKENQQLAGMQKPPKH